MAVTKAALFFGGLFSLLVLALYLNNSTFYTITLNILAIVVYICYNWYKSSFAPYEPNNGLKFELPPKEIYPFKHRWFAFTIDAKNPSNITLEPVSDPNSTQLPCIHYVDESPSSSDSNNSKNNNNLCFLLCHGNPTWSFLYRKLIKSLCGKYRCVSIDLPGFGLSTAPASYTFTTEQHSYIISAVVNKLGLNNIILVSQDWGGPTSYLFATNERNLGKISFKGFIIGNTWCWNISVGKRPDVKLFSVIYGGIIGRMFGIGWNFVINSFFIFGFYKKLDKSVRYWYDIPFERKYSRKGTWIWPKQIFDKRCNELMKDAELKLIENYGNKGVPCLLLWGLQDRAFIEKEELARWKLIFREHKVVKFDDASHFWQEDVGYEASKHILQWMDEKF